MSFRQQLVRTILSGALLLALPMPWASADASTAGVKPPAEISASSSDGGQSPAEKDTNTVGSTAKQGLRPKLIIVGLALDEQSEKISQILVRQANAAAQDSARFELSLVQDVLDADGAKITAENVKSASALLKQARDDYDNLELTDARAKAEQAIKLLQDTDLSTNFSLYIEARKTMIAALLADSENKAADGVLEKLLPQDPNSFFDPNIFSPDYIARVKERRADLEKNASGSMDLKTEPVSAQIYVDGVFQGVSPVEMRGLTAGEHVLTMVAPGYKVLQKTFTAGAADTRSERLTSVKKGFIYTPFLKALRGKFLSEARSQPAKDMAKFLGADQLAIVAVRNVGLHSYSVTIVRLDAADGHEYTNTETVIDDKAQTLEKSGQKTFAPLFAVDLSRGSDGEAVKAKVNPFHWRERHTAFVLYGLTAAAIGSGIVFGIDANNQAATYKDLTAPQNSPIYDRVEDVGRRSALIADISFGVAVAAAVTGTILLVHDILKSSGPSALAGEGEIDSGDGGKAAPTSSAAKRKDVSSEKKSRESDEKVESLPKSSSEGWDSDW